MTETQKIRLKGCLKLVQQTTEWAAVRQFFTAAATAEELPVLRKELEADLAAMLDIEEDGARQRVAR